MIFKSNYFYTSRMFLMLSASDGFTGQTGIVFTGSSGNQFRVSQPGDTSLGNVQGSGGGATEVNFGWYGGAISDNDVIWPGDLAFDATGTGALATDFVDQNQLQVVTDLNLNNGSIGITSHVKKNTRWSRLMFIMTDIVTNAPKTGLTPTSMRALNGGSFANTSNSASEISGGFYALTLESTDTNANFIQLSITAAGANPVYLELGTLT